MDNEGSTAGAQARPSFIADAENLVERVGEGLKDDGEALADRILGTGTAAEVETVAAAVATDVAGAAVATITALGAAHVNIGQIAPTLTAELASVKSTIESNIIALARHIAGAN